MKLDFFKIFEREGGIAIIESVKENVIIMPDIEDNNIMQTIEVIDRSQPDPSLVYNDEYLDKNIKLYYLGHSAIMSNYRYTFYDLSYFMYSYNRAKLEPGTPCCVPHVSVKNVGGHLFRTSLNDLILINYSRDY